MLVSRLFCLTLICVAVLTSACTGPKLSGGFDPEAFKRIPGADLEGRLRLPPGTDLNGPVNMVLVEGAYEDETAESHRFVLRRVGTPFPTESGSTVIAFTLKSSDYRRYDRVRGQLGSRIAQDLIASIRVQYRLCHRAGVPVSRPYVVGFLLMSDENLPIYLAETDLPADLARGQLVYCI